MGEVELEQEEKSSFWPLGHVGAGRPMVGQEIRPRIFRVLDWSFEEEGGEVEEKSWQKKAFKNSG